MFTDILRILSATVNGSLAELGYFPGSAQLLEQLRQQNLEFRTVTEKLNADNVTLQHMIDTQSQRVNELQHQLNIHRHELQRMHAQLNHVTIERDNLAMHVRMCVCICMRLLFSANPILSRLQGGAAWEPAQPVHLTMNNGQMLPPERIPKMQALNGQCKSHPRISCGAVLF